jgi:hypothetical protein
MAPFEIPARSASRASSSRVPAAIESDLFAVPLV